MIIQISDNSFTTRAGYFLLSSLPMDIVLLCLIIGPKDFKVVLICLAVIIASAWLNIWINLFDVNVLYDSDKKEFIFKRFGKTLYISSSNLLHINPVIFWALANNASSTLNNFYIVIDNKEFRFRSPVSSYKFSSFIDPSKNAKFVEEYVKAKMDGKIIETADDDDG